MLTVFFGTANYKLLPNKAIKPKMDERTHSHTNTIQSVDRERFTWTNEKKWSKKRKKEMKECRPRQHRRKIVENASKQTSSIPHTQSLEHSLTHDQQSILFYCSVCYSFICSFMCCTLLCEFNVSVTNGCSVDRVREKMISMIILFVLGIKKII